MSTSNTDANHVMGTIQDVAQLLYDELLMSGSSLMLTEVVKTVISATTKYASWSGLLQHCPKDDASCKNPLLSVTANTVLGVDDWAIIEPLVRAHCDLTQARRLEASQNLGVQPIGMSSSEALQYYNEAILTLKKEAFQCEPYSLDVVSKPSGFLSIWQRLSIGMI